mgnify:CR=1 FL=1
MGRRGMSDKMTKRVDKDIARSNAVTDWSAGKAEKNARKAAEKNAEERVLNEREEAKNRYQNRKALTIADEKAARDAGGMEPKALNKITPSFVFLALDQLKMNYFNALTLMRGYEYFVDNWETNGYDKLVKEGTKKLAEDLGESNTDGGMIETLEQACAAMGPVIQDGDGKPITGTNWLAQQTSWLMFGSLMGYNMHYQSPSNLEFNNKEGSWPGDKNLWEHVFNKNYASDEKRAESTEKEDKRLVSVYSARYVTGAPGAPEPGVMKDKILAKREELGLESKAGDSLRWPYRGSFNTGTTFSLGRKVSERSGWLTKSPHTPEWLTRENWYIKEGEMEEITDLGWLPLSGRSTTGSTLRRLLAYQRNVYGLWKGFLSHRPLERWTSEYGIRVPWGPAFTIEITEFYSDHEPWATMTEGVTPAWSGEDSRRQYMWGHILSPDIAYYFQIKGPAQSGVSPWKFLQYSTIAAVRAQLVQYAKIMVKDVGNLGPVRSPRGEGKEAPFYEFNSGTGKEQNGFSMNNIQWADGNEATHGTNHANAASFKLPPDSVWVQYRKQNHYMHHQTEEKYEGQGDDWMKRYEVGKLKYPGEITRKVKGQRGPSFTAFHIPDRVAIYPTMPLMGVEIPKKGDGTTWYNRAKGIIQDDGQGFGTEAEFKEQFTTDEAYNQIDRRWRYLFEECFPPLEEEGTKYKDGAGIVWDLHQQMVKVALHRRDGKDGVDAQFGDGDPTSESYRKAMETGKIGAVERILDFFGAGRQDEGTLADAYGEGTSAGGEAQADIEAMTEETQRAILNYKVLKPFDFQCFLVENIDLLSTFQERHATYNNIVTVRGEPGTTISKIKMGDKADAIQELLDLSPSVYALLTPYIKIYRVDYDETGQKPILQKEMPIPNFVDPEDIKQLTGAGTGRYDGWGIKSFSWSLDGVQPETVDNNISANLTFYFQTIDDLFQGARAAGGVVPKPLDLLISAATVKSVLGDKDDEGAAINEEKPPCFDFIKDNAHQRYEGAQYRIKIVAGWATPPNLAALVGPERAATLAEALKTTRESLYLQQTRHNINFNQDGSLQLSIDYQAALTGMLTSNKSDILGANDVESVAELKKLEEQIADKRKQTVEGELAHRNAHSASDTAGASQAISADTELQGYKEQTKELLEKKKKIINKDKLKKYKKFLSRLFGRDVDGKCSSTGPKIYSLVVNPDLLFATPWDQLTPDNRAKRARQRMSPAAGSRGFAMTATPGKTNTDLLKQVTDAILEEQELDPVEVSKTFREQWDEGLNHDENVNIPYFFLGDLIDSILEDNDTFGSSNTDRQVLMMLASLDVTNPLILYQVANDTAVLCADKIDDSYLIQQLRDNGFTVGGGPDSGIKKRISIGSLPISLDQFNVWFKNNVIRKERNTYYLIHFIKDLCSQLIGASLKSACFGNNLINDIRFDTSPIHFRNADHFGAPVEPTRNPHDFISVTRLSELAGMVDEHNDIPLGLPPDYEIPDPPTPRGGPLDKSVDQGLLLYATDAQPKGRDPRGEEGLMNDLQDGIYHNYIGASAGLVKKISFNRVDQEYLREAKIQKFGHLGAQQLRELYSAQIDLIGNTLYKNGQYTYIWPSMVGTEDELARLLGLGGYFLITGVKHTISPQGYNVTVTALQEGLSFGDDVVEELAILQDPEGLITMQAEEASRRRIDDNTVGQPDPDPNAATLKKADETRQPVVQDATGHATVRKGNELIHIPNEPWLDPQGVASTMPEDPPHWRDDPELTLDDLFATEDK